MTLIKVALLFALTACAEIVGCYLPYLWLKENKSAWLLLPAAGSIAFLVGCFLCILVRRRELMGPTAAFTLPLR